jgi:hypothetical protein
VVSLGLILTALSSAADPLKYRTDDNPDKALPWYQLVEGQFPPANSGHLISGELIQADHLERTFVLRVDRNDSQQAGHQDLPIEVTLLPYASIYYHGAPAALQDIPIGTHLHGLYYVRPLLSKAPLRSGPWRRIAADAAFTRCLRLEDDFSFYARQQQTWKIDEVNLEKRTLLATRQEKGMGVGKPQVFDLLKSTRVYQGKGFAGLDSLKAGQTVLFNLTWATLYGPGRVLEIWLDDESRQLAVAQQLEVHRDHTRQRGLPAWVEAVDDEKQIVTLTLFDSVDPKLFDELTHINPEPFGWPLSRPEDDPKKPKGTIAVAMPSLMTYDPVNDRKGGNILNIGKVPLEPGNSGIQVQVKCDMLLEGYRPKRIVRFFPGAWKVIALPREEEFHGRE